MTFLTIQFLSDHTNLFTMVTIAALHPVYVEYKANSKTFEWGF